MRRPLLIALLCASGFQSESSGQNAGLSPAGQTWLHTAIASGTLPDLRWPDFSDYVNHVQKFYQFNNYSLWWVNGMQPTAPARQVIAVLQQAGQKGLSADDYDGPRWSDRLAKLKPGMPQPAEADAVKFDRSRFP
jgi:hypothetical protein